MKEGYMSTLLRVMLGTSIAFGINNQTQASVVAEEVVRDRCMPTAHALAAAQALYEQGIDLRIQGKLRESFEVTKQAADAGWPMAQYAVGGMYLGGIGTDVDIESAFDYYEKCRNTIAEACNQMGAIYEGIFPQAEDYEDTTKALECYEQAGKLGLPAGRDSAKRLREALGIS